MTNPNLSTYGSLEQTPTPPTPTSSSTPKTSPNNTPPPMAPLSICAILSTAFSYGCIMTTLFLLVLPMECQRIEQESTALILQLSPSNKNNPVHVRIIRKSIALGFFAVIAGAAQLVTPLVGMLSDGYVPPQPLEQYPHWKALGKRLPYMMLGTGMIVVGLVGQLYASDPSRFTLSHLFPSMQEEEVQEVGRMQGGDWRVYTVCYAVHMVGLNVVYTGMIALIPDLVPECQTGVANGTLALQLVLGSLFGFGIFHVIVESSSSSSSLGGGGNEVQMESHVLAMYRIYLVVAVTAMTITFFYVREREEEMECLRTKNDGSETHSANTNHSNSLTIATDSDQTQTQNPPNPKTIHILPPPRQLLSLLFYQPISTKSVSDIAAAYWVDTNTHRDFFIVTISRFFYYMGISSQTFFLYYLHDKLTSLRSSSTEKDPIAAAVTVLAIVSQAAGAITCYPVGIISDRYFGGRRKPFVYLSCILLAVANVSLLACSTLREMMGVVALSGAANGVYLTMDTSLAVDTLPPDHEDDENENENNHTVKSGVERTDHGAAQKLGVWGVFGFVGSALGPLIGGTALYLVGKPDAVGEDSGGGSASSTGGGYYKESGYDILFSLSALYFFCSAVSLTFVQKQGV